MARALFETDHLLFAETVDHFIQRQIAPRHLEWEKAGLVDKAMFRQAGRQGLLGLAVPEEFGGTGVDDFRFNAVIGEAIMRHDVAGSGMCITLHNDIVLPYLLNLADPGQKARWLPGMASGEIMGALAMTEPGTGSDLAGIVTTAIREGDHYRVNGAKTFITNGINSDLVVVAVKTDPTARHAGMTLLVIEAGMEGFERGRNLDKIGLHAQDTAELFFTDVMVPVENRLGEEGMGFRYLVANLPQERLSLAVASVARSETVFEWTLSHVRERKAFGVPIGSNQVIRHRMAELRTEIDLARLYVDHQIVQHNAGLLSAEEAAKAKWWVTELEKRVVDSCLQFFGGWGYMEEFPIARAYRDARVQTIYGGTTEIMKEIIGKGLGL